MESSGILFCEPQLSSLTVHTAILENRYLLLISIIDKILAQEAHSDNCTYTDASLCDYYDDFDYDCYCC